MGNSNIHNAIPISDQNSPPDTKTSIISNLNLIENALSSFDVQLVAAKNMLEFKHNTLKSKLLNKFQTANLYSEDVIQKKTELKKAVLKAKRFSSIYSK